MVLALLIISFFLESIFSNIVPTHTIFSPLFTLMSIILIYPYFNKKNSSYYKTCFIIGLFYDLVYTDTIVFNAFLFVLMGLIIVKLNDLFANNYLNSGLMATIVIILYRIITYLFLILTGNINFSLIILFKSIYESLIANIIYIMVMYGITDYLSRKFKITKTT